jgi:ABC-2 type transport system ATP-binding protein
MSLTVRTDALSMVFRRHEAVHGLNLQVAEGSVYALLGASGAGKTTTLKIVVDLLRPSRGTAYVFGRDTRRLGADLRSQIGYVADSQQMPARLTVGRYLEYLRTFYPTWDRELEATICRRLALPLGRRIGELSHGMRIKAGLAAALPYRPRLLVLDEPFSGLDPLVRDEFMEELLSQAGELTLLIASQELGEIEHLTTHVGFMDQGRLLFEEPMEALQSRMREVRVVLEAPPALPAGWPREWLQPRVVGHVLTFIDARHVEAALAPRLAALLGPPRQLDTAPITLRHAFTALARAAREGALP